MSDDPKTTVVVIPIFAAGPDIPTAQTLARLQIELLRKQEPLGEPFSTMLYDNLWNLYVRS